VAVVRGLRGELRGHRVVLYTSAIAVAFVCLAFHGALAIYYALDPLSRRAARARSDT